MPNDQAIEIRDLSSAQLRALAAFEDDRIFLPDLSATDDGGVRAVWDDGAEAIITPEGEIGKAPDDVPRVLGPIPEVPPLPVVSLSPTGVLITRGSRFDAGVRSGQLAALLEEDFARAVDDRLLPPELSYSATGQSLSGQGSVRVKIGIDGWEPASRYRTGTRLALDSDRRRLAKIARATAMIWLLVDDRSEQTELPDGTVYRTIRAWVA